MEALVTVYLLRYRAATILLQTMTWPIVRMTAADTHDILPIMT